MKLFWAALLLNIVREEILTNMSPSFWISYHQLLHCLKSSCWLLCQLFVQDILHRLLSCHICQTVKTLCRIFVIPCCKSPYSLRVMSNLKSYKIVILIPKFLIKIFYIAHGWYFSSYFEWYSMPPISDQSLSGFVYFERYHMPLISDQPLSFLKEFVLNHWFTLILLKSPIGSLYDFAAHVYCYVSAP
jgi:hypothetical protein